MNKHHVSRTFGGLVLIYLHQAGKQQRELAQAVGVTPGYVSDLMANKRSPSAEVAERIGQVLNIPSDLVWFSLGVLPPDLRNYDVSAEDVLEGFEAMRHRLMTGKFLDESLDKHIIGSQRRRE